MPRSSLQCVTALVASFCLAGATQAALSPGVAAQILSLQGNGEQRRAEAAPWVTAKPTETLVAGAFVRTLAASKMALLFADDTQLRLNQNATLQVKSVAGVQQETTLSLTLGRAWAQTKRASGSRLNFETPAASAGIRGTDWELDVDASGKTLLTVFSGQVDFYNAQGSVTVANNEAAMAEVGKAPVKILLGNPRERIQWVNALSADPLRHLSADTVPPVLAPTLAVLTQGDLLAARAALTAAAQAPAGWLQTMRSAQAILAGDTVGAQQGLVRLLSQPGDAPGAAYLMLSDLNLIDGAFDQAAATLEAGLSKFPEDADLLAQLARVQMLADRLPESEKTLARVRSADTVSVLLAQGELARRQGQSAATLQAFTRSTRVAPADDRGWFGLGSAQNELEQISPARANIQQALKLQPQGTGYQGELGTLETFANRFSQAEQAFAAALAHNPADYVALTGLGLLRLKQGLPQQALDAFLRAGVMEPRYARAKTYTAVAYYQLGRHQDAIDTLQQSSQLDDKDPIPYLFLSQIFTDLLRPGEAVQASRDAVVRLPYLKSLNQLANDQKGSANFGASLAFFGLEDWALELAQRSYYPYWGGSHLFLADRYPGEFNKNSELYQGYLSDPLAFGASNRFSSLLQRAGQYGSVQFTYDKMAAEIMAPTFTLSGTLNERVPLAYFVQSVPVRANGYPIDVGVSSNLPVFADSSGSAEIDGSVTTLGLGLQPTPNLGLFFYHNAFNAKLLGHNTVLNYGAIQASDVTSTTFDFDVQHSALGLSYRWSPTAQTWLKFGNSKSINDIAAYPTLFNSRDGNVGTILSLYAKPEKQFNDVQLRHTMDLSRDTRVSFGIEHVKETQFSTVDGSGPQISASSGHLVLTDYLLFRGLNDISRDFTATTVGVQHRLSPSVLLDAALTNNQMTELVAGDSVMIRLASADIQPNSVRSDQSQNIVAPRVGLVFQPSDEFSLRVAYQDWVRPLSVGTLSNVDTAGIAVEDRLVVAGGQLKRSVVQLGWTPNASTHLSARLDHQDIHNPVAPGVDLRTPSLPFLESLRNVQNVNLTSLDLMEETPSLEDATLDVFSFSVNRLLNANTSAYLKYVGQDSSSSYVDTDAPSGRVTGKRIAYLPHDTLALGLTWAAGRRVMLGGRAVYRTERFEDMVNLTPWPASWSIDLLASWETQDKHWSFNLGALNLGGNKSSRQFEHYVFDARYRF
jgi:Flp pilus assembly protein TadD